MLFRSLQVVVSCFRRAFRTARPHFDSAFNPKHHVILPSDHFILPSKLHSNPTPSLYQALLALPDPKVVVQATTLQEKGPLLLRLKSNPPL